MIPGLQRFATILFYISGLLLGFVIYLLLLRNDNKEMIEGYRTKEKLLKKEVTIWKDKAGKSRAETVVFAASKDVIKQVMSEELEEMKKDIKGLKLKNLHSRTNVQTTLRDSFQVVLQKVNDSSVTYYDFNYTDSSGFNNYKGFIRDDRLTIIPEIKVPLTATIYRKRREKKYFFDFFPGKETVVQAKTENPKVTITDLEAIEVKKDKKFLGIF